MPADNLKIIAFGGVVAAIISGFVPFVLVVTHTTRDEQQSVFVDAMLLFGTAIAWISALFLTVLAARL